MEIRQRISNQVATGFERDLIVTNMIINFKDNIAVIFYEIEYFSEGVKVDIKLDVPDELFITLDVTKLPIRDEENNKIVNPEYTDDSEGIEQYLYQDGYEYFMSLLGDPSTAIKTYIDEVNLDGGFNF